MLRSFSFLGNDKIREWWSRLSSTEVWTRVMRHDLVPLFLLVPVGLFAFFYNLNLSLFEGTEGLYAHISQQMVRSHEYFQLTYQGEVYANKPPLFFWFLGLSTSLFGENEVALRLPGAVFSLGTMVLTYFLGKRLFSRTAGLCGALVVATTHVFLWYGRRVLIDSAITFFITLALLAWVYASLQKGNSWWYLLSFLSMAFGAMIKELHGFALPLLLIIVYSSFLRDFRALRTRSFWVSLLISASLVILYSLRLGTEFQWHFQVWNRLAAAFDLWNIGLSGRGPPIYYYLYMIWFDFFPWCALLPSSLVLLFSQRPLGNKPSELFALSWVLVFFLALSLAQPKREPYIMAIVPGLGLIIGYYYHTAFSSPKNRLATPLFKLMLGIVTMTTAAMMFFGPFLLQRRWNAPMSPFPTFYVVAMLGICGILMYAGARSYMRTALLTFGILAVGFLIGVVHVFLPAIDKAISARQISDEIKLLAKGSQTPFRLYSSGWPRNEDVVYYLSLEPEIRQIETEEALVDLVTEAGHVIIVVDKNLVASLTRKKDLSFTLLREFQQPRKENFVLLSVRFTQECSAGPSVKMSPTPAAGVPDRRSSPGITTLANPSLHSFYPRRASLSV